MTNCPNCGAPIKRYAHTCEYCGTALEEQKEDPLEEFLWMIETDDTEIPNQQYCQVILACNRYKIKPFPIYKVKDGKPQVYFPSEDNIRFEKIRRP